MSNNDNKLISLEHLGIVKQYIDTKCGDLSNDLYITSHSVEQNTQDIASIRNEIADLNLGGGGAMSNIDLLQFQVKRLENAGSDGDSDFDGLGIGKRFISLESGIDGLDTRISSLENQSSTDAGVTENANIDANTLINMINSDDVMNGVLTKNSKFGSGIISFISDNGTINASKIVGSLPASMLSGNIPASMLSGTINEDTIPSIPFSKIQSDTVGIKLNDTKAIEPNNTIWKLNGDGSGQITNAFTWDKDGKLTIGNNLISWSQLADESIPESLLDKILEKLGNGEDDLEMKNLLNNYFGKSIGYRVDANNANIINDKNENVITTVTDLLGDKIGVLEYNADNKVKTTTDADGNVMPVVTTVSNVIGDVTGAKAVYDSNNTLTNIEYDKDISVAAKFEEIEKNWIGKSFKPEFEVKIINGVSSASQTTQSVADVFNEMQTDWIGEGLKPIYVETDGVKTRKSQNVEDILNELKTKWLGEVIDETNGNSVKLGVVHNADGTITNNQSAAEIFNEMQVDWLGTGFKPSRDSNLIRTSQTVYDVIKEIKLEWLGGDISKSKSVTSIVNNLNNNINTNTTNITATTNTLNSHIAGYNTTIGNINTLIESMRGDIQDCDNRINAVNQSLFSSLTKEQVTNIINAAIQEGGLGETLATKADLNNYWTIENHNGYVTAHDQTHFTKDQIININELVNYLSITDTNTLNTMLNNAGVTSTTWYESIKNAILAIADSRYAEAATGSALSNYLTKTDASNTYLTQSNASSNYLTKTDASNTYLSKTDASNTYLKTSTANSTYLKTSTANSTYLSKTDASSTYVPLTTYNQLATKYDKLKEDYDDLLARVTALESKVQ